jgi:hypothetical protein
MAVYFSNPQVLLCLTVCQIASGPHLTMLEVP